MQDLLNLNNCSGDGIEGIILLIFFNDERPQVLTALNPCLSQLLFRQWWALGNICLPKAAGAAQYFMNTWRCEPLSLCSPQTRCCCVVPNWHSLWFVLLLYVNWTHFQQARCHADASAILQHLNKSLPQCIQSYFSPSATSTYTYDCTSGYIAVT